jgi:hypothetical protein
VLGGGVELVLGGAELVDMLEADDEGGGLEVEEWIGGIETVVLCDLQLLLQ